MPHNTKRSPTRETRHATQNTKHSHRHHTTLRVINSTEPHIRIISISSARTHRSSSALHSSLGVQPTPSTAHSSSGCSLRDSSAAPDCRCEPDDRPSTMTNAAWHRSRRAALGGPRRIRARPRAAAPSGGAGSGFGRRAPQQARRIGARSARQIARSRRRGDRPQRRSTQGW